MYTSNFIESKYYFSIAKRMLQSYEEFPDKRFLTGVINESAIAVIKLIKTVLELENKTGGIQTFEKKLAPKYIDKQDVENLIKILKIKESQTKSPIEFKRQEKIILLIDGKYRILTKNRLVEFVNSLEKSIKKLEPICRQV